MATLKVVTDAALPAEPKTDFNAGVVRLVPASVRQYVVMVLLSLTSNVMTATATGVMGARPNVVSSLDTNAPVLNVSKCAPFVEMGLLREVRAVMMVTSWAAMDVLLRVKWKLGFRVMG